MQEVVTMRLRLKPEVGVEEFGEAVRRYAEETVREDEQWNRDGAKLPWSFVWEKGGTFDEEWIGEVRKYLLDKYGFALSDYVERLDGEEEGGYEVCPAVRTMLMGEWELLERVERAAAGECSGNEQERQKQKAAAELALANLDKLCKRLDERNRKKAIGLAVLLGMKRARMKTGLRGKEVCGWEDGADGQNRN